MTAGRLAQLRRKAEAFAGPAASAAGVGLSRDEGLELVGEVDRLRGAVAALAAMAAAVADWGPA